MFISSSVGRRTVQIHITSTSTTINSIKGHFKVFCLLPLLSFLCCDSVHHASDSNVTSAFPSSLNWFTFNSTLWQQKGFRICDGIDTRIDRRQNVEQHDDDVRIQIIRPTVRMCTDSIRFPLLLHVDHAAIEFPFWVVDTDSLLGAFKMLQILLLLLLLCSVAMCSENCWMIWNLIDIHLWTD